MVAYLREEQRLGRVARSANPDAAAMLLIGPLAHGALIEPMVGAVQLPLSRDRLTCAPWSGS